MARPREFDPAEAVERIKDVFWRLGYEGASMQEIEAATSLNKQSLYRVFGDKRGMYLAALRSYEETEVAAAAAALAQPGSARERFARLFGAVLAAYDVRGCFLCNASIDQAPGDAPSADAVARMMRGVKSAFADALAESAPYKADQSLRERKAAALMASYFGLRVMIRARMPKELLTAAATDAVDSIDAVG